MSEKSILQIKNLSKNFKLRRSKLFEKPQELHALSNISIDIEEGETLGIIGESGCGKSTFGRCIVNLHRASYGEIIYNGTNIVNKKGSKLKELRKDIQMIFQDPYSSLDPRKTAGAAIEEPMKIHNISKGTDSINKVSSLMQEVGLDSQYIYRYPHEFSGGQRQRVGLARALAMDPKILVADEPVSALDVSVQAQVLELLARLQDQLHLSILFITHDLRVAAQVCDRIAVMKSGQIVEQGESAHVFGKPSHPYTQALLAAVPGRHWHPEAAVQTKMAEVA